MTYYELVTNTPISKDILEAALRGLTQERAKIEDQVKEIEAMLRGTDRPAKTSASTPVHSATPTGKRTMSLEARKRIAEAQRRRWAASKGEDSTASKTAPASKKATKKATKGKRTMSPEVRARMAEAQRKRWAAKKQ